MNCFLLFLDELLYQLDELYLSILVISLDVEAHTSSMHQDNGPLSLGKGFCNAMFVDCLCSYSMLRTQIYTHNDLDILLPLAVQRAE